MVISKYKQIQNVQLVVIVLNIAASVSKLLAGFLSGSVSMIADGLHSMADGLNNVVGMIGVYFAFKPIDEKHPYGHRKFETMTTLFIGALLFITSISVIKGAYSRFLNPVSPTVTIVSFVVMTVSILINIFVTVFEKKRGVELKSDFLVSDATHTLSDVFVSISVMGTLFAVRFGFPWVDTAISLIIAIIIAKAAYDVIKNGTNVLVDTVVLDPEDISQVVCEFEDVYSCHKIRSRGCADDIHLDLHVVARNGMTLERAHNMVHNIENLLICRFPGVTDVNIHVDPLDYYLNKTSSK